MVFGFEFGRFVLHLLGELDFLLFQLLQLLAQLFLRFDTQIGSFRGFGLQFDYYLPALCEGLLCRLHLAFQRILFYMKKSSLSTNYPKSLVS